MAETAMQLWPTPGQELMPPPTSRAKPMPPKPKELVLDEDEWAEQLEAIIERDFFPDVPKLQSKLEWLQALRTRDPAALRQAQVNIASRRAGIRTPIGATPGTFETPGASLLRAPHTGMFTPAQTPGMTPLMHHNALPPDSTAERPAAAPLMTLDRFMAKYTSEDNASFVELLEDLNKRRAAQHAWLHKRPGQQDLLALMDTSQQESRALHGDDSSTDAKPRLLWHYEPKNRLYYDGSQQVVLAPSAAEEAARVAGPPKEIRHRNTRFVGASAPSTGGNTPASDSQSGTPAADGSQGAAAADELRGYGLLATPSFTPGAGGESPFMTWGDIASTPLRLDAEDTPLDIGGCGGPKFHVADMPKKDLVGRHMAAKAGASLKRRAASYVSSPLARQPAARAGGGGKTGRLQTPGVAKTPLSAAGRRLASSLQASGHTPRPDAADIQLRASYKGTPVQTATPSGASTPQIGKQEAAELAKLRAAALDTKQRVETGRPLPAGGKLTDDLLNI